MKGPEMILNADTGPVLHLRLENAPVMPPVRAAAAARADTGGTNQRNPQGGGLTRHPVILAPPPDPDPPTGPPPVFQANVLEVMRDNARRPPALTGAPRDGAAPPYADPPRAGRIDRRY